MFFGREAWVVGSGQNHFGWNAVVFTEQGANQLNQKQEGLKLVHLHFCLFQLFFISAFHLQYSFVHNGSKNESLQV